MGSWTTYGMQTMCFMTMESQSAGYAFTSSNVASTLSDTAATIVWGSNESTNADGDDHMECCTPRAYTPLGRPLTTGKEDWVKSKRARGMPTELFPDIITPEGPPHDFGVVYAWIGPSLMDLLNACEEARHEERI